MVLRLPDTAQVKTLELRMANLIERTFLKGALGKRGPDIQPGVKQAFNSATYQLQLDQIIDDIFRVSVAYADEQLGNPPSIYAALNPRPFPLGAAAGGAGKPLPITAELIKESGRFNAEVAESMVRFLEDNRLYELHPNQLAKYIKDQWGGSKYRATRFARTCTADIAVNTAITRYEDMGIERLQFYAKIDDRTSSQCRMFHGLIIDTNSPDIQKYRPPLHHNCLVAGTKIKTINGERNIEDIKVGTKVLTHLSNYMPVYDTMVRDAVDIIEISTSNRNIKITANHPVLTKRNDNFVWIKAGELHEEDEIVVI